MVVLLLGAIHFVPFLVAIGGTGSNNKLVDKGDLWMISIPVLILVFAVIGFFEMLKPLRRQYANLRQPASRYNKAELARWEQGLEAASIAAGMSPPPLVPVRIPTANAVAFEVGGRPTVGVTTDALDARVPYDEIEAVMAHEVAHVTTRTYLRSPVLRDRPFILLPFIAGAFLTLFFMFIFPLYMSIASMVLIFVPFILGYYIGRDYPVSDSESPVNLADIVNEKRGPKTGKQMKGRTYDNDLLADSIAAKMISEPQALRKALGRTAALIKEAPVMPPERVAYNFLFMGPLKPWEPPGFDRPGRRDAKADRQDAQQVIDYVGTREELLSERLQNLRSIERGVWRVFEEVVGGEVQTTIAGWDRD